MTTLVARWILVFILSQVVIGVVGWPIVRKIDKNVGNHTSEMGISGWIFTVDLALIFLALFGFLIYKAIG